MGLVGVELADYRAPVEGSASTLPKLKEQWAATAIEAVAAVESVAVDCT